MKLTQRERVLALLKKAGPRGVRSDIFLDLHIPRVAARVLELRKQGYEISSEKEKQYCRYRLESVGTGAGGPLSGAGPVGRGKACASAAGVLYASAGSSASDLKGAASQGYSAPERAGEPVPPVQDSPALQLFQTREAA